MTGPTDPYDLYGSSDPYGPDDPYAAPPAASGPSALTVPTAYPYPYPSAPVPPPTSGTAVASLVLGILALTLCAGITSIPGLICAAVGMRETREGRRSGGGIAVAGLILSILGLLVLVLELAWFAFMILTVWIGVSQSTGY
ncbi:DUF4190 domain-containing protein [Brachybacterium huguangmaarense]|uniref:DUF4190 domain-containing protein n=1 Tax=Brachybacterium huguangmaarense TaxID=1652028 RepID=A0ABY6G456_9MICO|nr:DUF4190 domain-containing protein [Brachybacterium huguangmaarense]UYG18003.1 DUF4190 domain-containing protein [Brachybacterium huguangmaarense]